MRYDRWCYSWWLTVCCALVLVACGGSPSVVSTTDSNQQIRLSQQTNEVALSNLKLGIAYLREGSYEKALRKLERAREADPNYSPTYNMLGLLYQQLGDTAKAERYFKKAISLNRSDSTVLNNYGRLLCGLQRLDAAERQFLRAIENPLYETPEIPTANLGICLYNNNDKERARDYLNEALQLNPRMAKPLLLMSEFSYEAEDYLSANGYLQRYRDVDQPTPKSLWLGVRIEQKLGNRDAVSSYALLLRNLFPDSKEAMALSESGIE